MCLLLSVAGLEFHPSDLDVRAYVRLWFDGPWVTSSQSTSCSGPPLDY